MTEESSHTSQLGLSVVMTTTGMTQNTGENTMTPSLSRGIEFYFHCAIVVMGVVGTATNALILYAMVASKQHKKHVLIFSQNALDLFSSFIMLVNYSLKLCNIHLIGSAGYWLCTLLLSDSLIWSAFDGSAISLASITIERYLKVVHPVWSKKKLRNWMIYLAVAFSWIGSFTYGEIVVFLTSAVVDGACYAYRFWVSETARICFDVWNFVSFYVITLLIFIFCYWRILVVIRRQASVMAGYDDAAGPSTAQTVCNQLQSSVVKTMIFVSAFYAIARLPTYIYIFNIDLNPNAAVTDGTSYYAIVIIAFLYTCTNPFIYAIKFDPVKEVLQRLIRCKKTSE